MTPTSCDAPSHPTPPNPQPHHAINIIGFNSPEWLIANCGAIAAGGVAVGIYTTNNVEACQYISEHSEAEVIVVENAKQLEKFTDISHQLPNLKVNSYVCSGHLSGRDLRGVCWCRKQTKHTNDKRTP